MNKENFKNSTSQFAASDPDETPNEVTLAAIEEMENGGGRLVDDLRELFVELEQD